MIARVMADFGNQEELNEVSHKIPPEAFAVKWTGDVLIKQLGTYTFYTTSFDGSRVFVDNQLIVDNSGVSFCLCWRGSQAGLRAACGR